MIRHENMPMLTTSTYGSTSYSGDRWLDDSMGIGQQTFAANLSNFSNNVPRAIPLQNIKEITMSGRRLIQVLIVDPNENVPLDKCLLYKGDPKLTDATDQELFFEIDMKSILQAHNEERVQFIDKKVKDRTEYLEPAKIRDLKMVVVNIAQF